MFAVSMIKYASLASCVVLEASAVKMDRRSKPNTDVVCGGARARKIDPVHNLALLLEKFNSPCGLTLTQYLGGAPTMQILGKRILDWAVDRSPPLPILERWTKQLTQSLTLSAQHKQHLPGVVPFLKKIEPLMTNLKNSTNNFRKWYAIFDQLHSVWYNEPAKLRLKIKYFQRDRSSSTFTWCCLIFS